METGLNPKNFPGAASSLPPDGSLPVRSTDCSWNYLTLVARHIGSILPGQAVHVDPDELLAGHGVQARAQLVSGFYWNIAEQLMEKIPGSAYEFQFYQDPVRGRFVFIRLSRPLKDGSRTYVSPDRRHLFRQDQLGYFWPL